ncbi:hypothetical protein RhiirC2_794748 [Rhizophagus irregularis]|uniref:Uncharacterized protein n=1 Tax=Rhizophagus irregularis TaxID=588596 RepID=A0A2N1MCX8_9GLOM|nr:hypothetical protein RhiirC2_794748 [Rhizophagus irregularis]
MSLPIAQQPSEKFSNINDSLPGNTVIAKKNFAYKKILDVLGLISLAPTAIKGMKVIQITYGTKAQVEEICKRKIADDNEVKFTKMEVISNQQQDNLNDYEIKI